MSDAYLFYSWQSDTPEKHNHYFIRDACQSALVQHAGDVVDAVRLDHDTKNVAGTPTISGTLFDKIDGCCLFVADVTLGWQSRTTPDDLSPNPNVLLELGYAANRLGWNRVLLVMNQQYGTPDKLIFDLQHRRWPLTYDLAPDASNATIKLEQQKLKRALHQAITIASQSGYSFVRSIAERLNRHAIEIYKAFGHLPSFAGPTGEQAGKLLWSLPREAAILHLLQLGLLRCKTDLPQNLYAYHWTFLGKTVGQMLGMTEKPREGDDSLTFTYFASP